MSKKTVGFVLGSIFGAAAGVITGILIAPRSGAESRAMAADQASAPAEAVHVEVVEPEKDEA